MRAWHSQPRVKAADRTDAREIMDPILYQLAERDLAAAAAKMVRPGRFERPTYRFVVCCSIQLS